MKVLFEIMILAPIILFVYNRPWHTEKTLKALEQNYLASDSELFIYLDGLKTDDTEEINHHLAVKKVISRKWEFKKITIVQRPYNFGLDYNIVDGVSSIVKTYSKIIVLEDDLLTSPFFLIYCNEGLDLYKDEKHVYSINAFQFPIGNANFKSFLSPLAFSSWGWATWADRWKYYHPKPLHKELIQSNVYLRQRFNLANYDYCNLLNNPKAWDIRWYYSVFLRGGLGLFPTISLVENIGFDGSGENCGEIDFQISICESYSTHEKLSEIDLDNYGRLLNYFSNNSIGEKEVIVPRKSILSRFISMGRQIRKSKI